MVLCMKVIYGETINKVLPEKSWRGRSKEYGDKKKHLPVGYKNRMGSV